MNKKVFGTCMNSVQKNLRFSINHNNNNNNHFYSVTEYANSICCNNREFAEQSKYFIDNSNLIHYLLESVYLFVYLNLFIIYIYIYKYMNRMLLIKI